MNAKINLTRNTSLLVCLGTLAVLASSSKAQTTGVSVSAVPGSVTLDTNTTTGGHSARQTYQAFLNGQPSVHTENGQKVNWSWSLSGFSYATPTGGPYHVADSQVPGTWANVFPDPNDDTLAGVRLPLLPKAQPGNVWGVDVTAKATVGTWYDSGTAPMVLDDRPPSPPPPPPPPPPNIA